jgi:hypothetical protein
MNDDAEQTCLASAEGILHCLRMLAEEAAALRLSRTQLAIQEALETCLMEGAGTDPASGAGLARLCLH